MSASDATTSGVECRRAVCRTTGHATFALPEVTLGYIPSAGGTQTLPRLVPAGIAASMILTGEPIDSGAALRWTLIDERRSAEELDTAIESVVAEALQPGGSEKLRARRLRMLSTENHAAAAAIRS